MKTFSLSNRLAVILLASSFAVSSVFAQGDFEGSGEVPDPNCVGDGCGFVSADQAEQNEESANYSYDDNSSAANSSAEEPWPDSTEQASADSTENEVATANIDEEDEETPHYIEENAAEYRARKEGFSKGVQFGIRAAAGVSKSFGKHASDWNLGPEFGGGLMARLPLGRTFAVATELDFSYRLYSYESKSDYGKNEASINESLFEIPVMGQFIFDEDGFFIGLGVNLGLKMSGDSEFKQTIKFEGETSKDKRPNTVPTVGVEIGGLFDIGYVVNRWLVLDLRAVQNLTNLLDLDLIAESTLMHSKLYTMHITLGATLLL
ncbi:Outer membrane protein beta-barrel domain-containing protein [Fibrobacter sp. UWB15]|uniref:outer membrane beta-barrel protein n=1 Tax=unclassified Fibrobacter TaxID=2634177 RepID=UPI00090F6F3A|nr:MULTISPECIES: outer membrane beta-barrel protein [unclassified Fibrobacter]PWJ63520.1 outer membrane protein with beta-barrel domain [Fibrobacter sp. UWB6]SHG29906.1 Outer membrane protein beta-barrel domain-containing protein [Fibrobacter sp. UWB8]SMG36760.1 Outer membrane protein beta-barrel domain-containing protein [Fibrobacter sp. UWB15]